MNKLFSKTQDQVEYGAILRNHAETAASANQVAETSATVVNGVYEKLQTLTANQGPYSVRVLGLVGGLAMILTNAIQIVPRCLILNGTGAILALYGVLFGALIVLLEANTNPNLQQGVRYYARFLETIWGRGLFYLFNGTLQLSNGNWIDGIVGGFMMLVGVLAMVAGVQVAHKLRKVRATIDGERALKTKWKQWDQGAKGYWNLADMAAFVQDSGIPITQNEMIAAYTAINRSLDDQLTYQELLQWWSRAASRDAEYYMERISV